MSRLAFALALFAPVRIALGQFTRPMLCDLNPFPPGPAQMTTEDTLNITQMCTISNPPSTQACVGDQITVDMPECTNAVFNDIYLVAQNASETLTNVYDPVEFSVQLTRIIAQWSNVGEPMNAKGCPMMTGTLQGADLNEFPDFVIGIYASCAYNPITNPEGAGKMCGNGTMIATYTRSPNQAACAQPPPPTIVYALRPPPPPPHPPITVGPTGTAPPAPPNTLRMSPPPSPPSPPTSPPPPSPPMRSPPPPSPPSPPPIPPSPPPRPPPRPPPPHPPPSPPHYLAAYGCNERADADCRACGGRIHPNSCKCLCPFSKWESIVLGHIGFVFVSLVMVI
jgi:hypothetical protein